MTTIQAQCRFGSAEHRDNSSMSGEEDLREQVEELKRSLRVNEEGNRESRRRIGVEGAGGGIEARFKGNQRGE